MTTKNPQAALETLVLRVGSVRKWLVALLLLRTAAAGIAFVMLYIGGYALADHYLHFGAAARVTALCVFIAGVVILAVRLGRALASHVSASAAARHIEGQLNLDQQLQSAIEYHENKTDYPYSKALAEYLILSVERATEKVRFDSTVSKWQARACAAAIAAGVVIGAIFLHGHYVFLSTYLSRLARPLANVAPLPATMLVSVTGDMVVVQGAAYTLEAEIQGRVPERGALEVSSSQGAPSVESSAQARPERTIEVFAQSREGKAPRFATQPTLDIGSYRYRFTAASAATGWHSLRVASVPAIKSITADVSLPRSNVVKPYTTTVEDYSLSVLRGSQVTLEVEPTEPLAEAVVTGVDGEKVVVDSSDARTFTLKFKASRDGDIRFALRSAAGISNDKIPPLEVQAKPDEPPQITLASPDGNLLVTNVASVPISFEVADDFGLKSADIRIELAGEAPRVIDIPVARGAREAKGSYTLELEDCPLTVGDSVLVYAEASDVDAGVEGPARHASTKGDIYFLEVRPYRTNWFPPPPSTPQAQQQADSTRQTLASLRLILEYTRAIIRKTWALGNDEILTKDDLAKIGSLIGDVNYCATQLGKHKADPHNGFIAADLGECIGNFSLAGKQLALHKPREAVDPEKEAYRGLRKLVDELDKLCPPGNAIPPETRDRLIVDEKVHLKRYDSESAADAVGRIADQIDRTAAQEGRVSQEFKHFLNDAKKGADYEQATTDEKSWQDPNQAQPADSRPSQGRPGSPPAARVSVEGSQLSGPPAAASSGGSPSSGERASPGDRLRVFQARQRALQGDAAALKDALKSLPDPDAKALADAKTKDDASRYKGARAVAQEELGHAENNMGMAQDGAARLYSSGLSDAKAEKETQKALDSATERLYKARDALTKYTESKTGSDERLALATELTKLADEYDRTQNASVKDKLLADIKKAQGMLASPSSASKGQSKGQGKGQGQAAGSSGNGGSGSGGLGMATQPVLGGDTSQPAATARYLAMRFWTLALQAKRRPSKTSQEEPSNAELHNVENAFYEQAAQYSKERAGK